MALLGFNNCFLSHNSQGEISCDSKRAGEDEMIKVLVLWWFDERLSVRLWEWPDVYRSLKFNHRFSELFRAKNKNAILTDLSHILCFYCKMLTFWWLFKNFFNCWYGILIRSSLCECRYILNYEKLNWSFSLFIYPGSENVKNRLHIDDWLFFTPINQQQFWVASPNTSMHVG